MSVQACQAAWSEPSPFSPRPDALPFHPSLKSDENADILLKYRYTSHRKPSRGILSQNLSGRSLHVKYCPRKLSRNLSRRDRRKKARHNLHNPTKQFNFASAIPPRQSLGDPSKCPGGGMVDALVSGASAARRAGSSPVLGTHIDRK